MDIERKPASRELIRRVEKLADECAQASAYQARLREVVVKMQSGDPDWNGTLRFLTKPELSSHFVHVCLSRKYGDNFDDAVRALRCEAQARVSFLQTYVELNSDTRRRHDKGDFWCQDICDRLTARQGLDAIDAAISLLNSAAAVMASTPGSWRR